ncbi:hypothetical protein KAR91_31790 [Candidatus Pacearchaeota archaeon]|nr:hypothetical protein [Candidatus Pacearchaeota archaeon]
MTDEAIGDELIKRIKEASQRYVGEPSTTVVINDAMLRAVQIYIKLKREVGANAQEKIDRTFDAKGE